MLSWKVAPDGDSRREMLNLEARLPSIFALVLLLCPYLPGLAYSVVFFLFFFSFFIHDYRECISSPRDVSESQSNTTNP